MPVTVPHGFPAAEYLKSEHIAVDEPTAAHSLSAPSSAPSFAPSFALRLAVLNLMPMKRETEADLLRLFSNSPLRIEIDWVRPGTHVSKNTPAEHLREYYAVIDDVKDRLYDGFVVTGAPVEHLEFEAVDYWDEIAEFLDRMRTRAGASLFVCWAAQAALYHYYGVRKYPLPNKMFGVFEHTVGDAANPLFRGFDDVFYAPHSRYTEIRREEVLAVPELRLVSESDEAGVYVVQSRNGRETFVTGHSEYAPDTLHKEYLRDVAKNLPIDPPRNYYPHDNPDNPPTVRWRSHANLLFVNWLNYCVLKNARPRNNNIELL
ncbi:MAG: homoserine O-succinyltransferase [Prevotellaceae bacterium]|jgi:homoserine O-succinyltransferase|nr:homoserine O-succinyltransferase [Prevotellaceae bacterium]